MLGSSDVERKIFKKESITLHFQKRENMDGALSGTSSFNTACLIILTIERVIYYLAQLLNKCLVNNDTRVYCDSCCGLFRGEMEQSESERESSINESDEVKKVAFQQEDPQVSDRAADN